MNHEVKGVRKGHRIYRELTPDEETRLKEARAQVADELPELIERHRLAKAAQEEESFSGELRRRIHRSGIPISQIARRCDVSLQELDEFLTGERTLTSDVIGRLVDILGCKLVPIK